MMPQDPLIDLRHEEPVMVHDELTGKWHKCRPPSRHSALHLDPYVAVVLDGGMRASRRVRRK